MANHILPGNPRYQPRNLVDHFGYDNIFRFVAEVEIANLRTLADIGVISQKDISLLTPELEKALLEISTTEVDKIERAVTKHDIRAWVQIAQQMLPPELRRWLHVPLTSYDAIDTARSLQFVRAHKEVVSPLIHQFVGILIKKVEEHADVLQIGRTHGQHALPITVGFWLATILNRVLINAMRMDEFATHFVGKISGAVGAYNAQVGVGILEKSGGESFEERVLAKLGLQPAPISTQILPPEHFAYYFFSVTMMTASLGQFGRDCRHLMRTEIGEIGEPFESKQVGSSTMAHKRNPINFENLEGMWIRTKNELGKVLDTLISEHQRDLVGSSVARDFPIMVINLVQQLNTLLRKNDAGEIFLERIAVDRDALRRNFDLQSKVILAEPLYIALQMAGYAGDAHHLVNHKAMPLSQKEGITLIDAVRKIAEDDDAISDALGQIPDEVRRLLEDPESYVGKAAEKARAVCSVAHGYQQSGIWHSIVGG